MGSAPEAALTGKPGAVDAAPVPALEAYSPRVVRWFSLWLRRYFRKHFDAVRTGGHPLDGLEGPLVVVTNHPSWWDPIHFVLVGVDRFPARRLFGPMDAEALRRYPILKKLGIFGVERGSLRGHAAFVKTARAILSAPDAGLFVTGEGQFTDPRNRPVQLQAGLAHLLRRMERGYVIPLAVEYPFWNERKPVALSRFGEPIDLSREQGRSVEAWTRLLEQRLQRTLDRLSEDARSRDPARFQVIVQGRSGVGGIYDLWRRLGSWLRGRRFVASHEEDPR